MTTPESLIDLLMLQPPEQRINGLLTKYLVHHPDSAVRAVVEQAIASSDLELKMRVLNAVLLYG